MPYSLLVVTGVAFVSFLLGGAWTIYHFMKGFRREIERRTGERYTIRKFFCPGD
ncbi:hypothetical protein [Halarchaeum acidiphilum]|uniref:hypothetical protein n=1 Tax=Halarchaeum acidiphilum TaxID=489138 RepID=UPI0003748C83|nr:hypothetical protein [Halarchaeum acidiphilum]